MVVAFKGQQLVKAEQQMEQTLSLIFSPQYGPQTSGNLRDRRFHAWIGCSVTTAAKVWLLLGNNGLYSVHGRGASMGRLCWALYMLKNYPQAAAGAAAVGAADEMTQPLGVDYD